MSAVKETEIMPRTKEEIEADRIMKTFRKDVFDINTILKKNSYAKKKK